MEENNVNVLFAGAAGQGLVTVGAALGKSLVRAGYFLHVNQTYESRVRGGHNTFAVRAGVRACAAPQTSIDILVAFNQQAIDQHASQLCSASLIISDTKLPVHNSRHIRTPADLGAGSQQNSIMLGVVGALLGLKKNILEQSLLDQLGDLGEKVVVENLASLGQAYEWALTQAPAFKRLGAPPFAELSNIMLNGNEAIALGAMAAGLKFYAFYPMSPSTSISLAVADAAPRMGIVVEQTEDEIAAINMALGASYAGARAMVATSGGGFDLMCEGISLAGMIEVPVVVAIAMRPGPATGLPTRTEQADLNLALYAGHGEFPRAILAPGNPAQCVRLAVHAFELAERYQISAFILTDQYLSDCYSNVKPFAFKDVPPLASVLGNHDHQCDYARFALSASGVSPRALPGLGKTLAISDSDEHDAQGYLTEDLEWRVKIQDKRMAKLEGLREEALPPSFSGPEEPDLMLCCWGSALGAVAEAASLLGEQKVGVCHFQQLYPLNPAGFLPRLQKAKKVVMVESNASGQMARLLHAETGFSVHGKVLRYDGLALDARYIVSQLASCEE